MRKYGAGASTLHVVTSHGDFHPGNVPKCGGDFYLLDLESFDFRPEIFDLATFCFVPVSFNAKYARNGFRLFEKLVEEVDVRPLDLLVSLATIDTAYLGLTHVFEKVLSRFL